MAEEKEWHESATTMGITNALASFIRTITRLVSNRRHDWNSSDT